MNNIQRRDRKNRILRQGESQRKDGRYCYKYTDIHGNTNFLYSWKLTDADIIPKGKRDCISLRSQIEELQKEKMLYGGTVKSKITVRDLLDMFIVKKEKINKPSTVKNKKYLIRTIEKEEKFCNTPIKKINISCAKKLLDAIQTKHHFNIITIRAIKGILRLSFDIAIENEWIYRNPFDFRFDFSNETTYSAKEGLTDTEYKSLMRYIKHHYLYNKYYDLFNVLFETGLRVSELAGLTVEDIDFDGGVIRINKQLLYMDRVQYIESPKTHNSNRYVPITAKARDSLARAIEDSSRYENSIDGYSGFIFLNRDHKPYTNSCIEQIFSRVEDRFNRDTGQNIFITPHICRHTFCSNMVRKGMNPKILQNIMGHSDIKITYNVYTTIQPEDVINELNRIRFL